MSDPQDPQPQMGEPDQPGGRGDQSHYPADAEQTQIAGQGGPRQPFGPATNAPWATGPDERARYGGPPQSPPQPDPRQQWSNPGYDGASAPGGYGQQPPYPGRGGAPPPPAQPGLGHPNYGQTGYGTVGAGPSSQQIITWIALGGIAFFGLLGAILTGTLLSDLISAVGKVSDICDRYGGQASDICRQTLKEHGPHIPAAVVAYLVLMILGSLAALGGAVLMFVKKYFGHWLVIGGGAVMLLFAIISEVQYGSAGRITYDLIAGLLITAAGGAMFAPQVRLFLGMPPRPASGPRPGQFGGGPSAYGPPAGPYGQPAGPYGPPGGAYGQPPPAYGRPPGPYDQPAPDGYGQSPGPYGPPGPYGQPPGPYGPPGGGYPPSRW
jgi:hypothetical protein